MSDGDVRAAQRAAPYPLTWVGRSLAGLPLTALDQDNGATFFGYGRCVITGDDGGCTPPLSIEVTSVCDRNALMLDIRPDARFTARGAEVLDYRDRGLQLVTGATAVVVSAAPRLARRALHALHPLGQPRGDVLPAARYPRYYLGQLLRVTETLRRTRSLEAAHRRLGISRSAVRFELGLARRLGLQRLRNGGQPAVSLRKVRHDRLAALRTGRAGSTRCALEPPPG